MRKKLLALLCALMLLVQLTPAAASAAGGVYFTAANETIRELTEATMPFWANGDLYVDGTLFENKDLYTGYFYNAAKNMAVVYSRKTANYALYFDLNKNRVDNADGYGYYPPAIARGGTIFLPISLVTSYFELGYVNMRVEYGHLLRVRSDKAVLDDKTLADAGGVRMESQYQQYMEARAAAQQGQAGTSGGAAAAVAAKGQMLQLCFSFGGEEKTAALLALLDSSGARGTFYLTAEEIGGHRDLVRRMAATGHVVGLMAAAGAETEVTEQLRLANEELWRTAGLKTRLCQIEEGTDSHRQAAEAAGYRCLRPDVDRSAYGLRTSGAASYLFGQISGSKGEKTIWLADGAETAGLRTFLRLAAEADDRLLGLTETD